MSVYKVKVGDKEYTVKIVEEKEGALEIDVDGTKLTVSLESLEKAAGTQQATVSQVEAKKEEAKPVAQPVAQPATPPPPPPAQQTQVAVGAITSRVPGKIKEVKVSEGQSVKRGDTVIIMESMKMEIEVKANKDGVVKAIYVKPGQFVTQGAPLILIE
jgi:biotin carboxyl carrier protein